MCGNDRVTCQQHVNHRLEISFGYAKHYLGVSQLMINLQVACVDVCQRSQTVHTTCGQRSGTCESYAGIRREISSMKNFEDNQKVQRLKPAYNDVWQCFSACSQCYQNLPITYSTCASVLEKKFKNRHTLAKTSRCDWAFRQLNIHL